MDYLPYRRTNYTTLISVDLVDCKIFCAELKLAFSGKDGINDAYLTLVTNSWRYELFL